MIRNGATARVLQYLLDHPDGGSAAAIANATGCSRQQVHYLAIRNRHVYIDRWEAYAYVNNGNQRLAWRPVYCRVPPVVNAEKPTRKPTQQDLENSLS